MRHSPIPELLRIHDFVRSTETGGDSYGFLVIPLYVATPFGTLARDGQSSVVVGVDALDDVARAVPVLLRSRGAAPVITRVPARVVGRQRPQIDAGDAGARDGARLLPGVSEFHHPCAVGPRRAVALPVGRVARATRRPDPRRHAVPQTWRAFGRRRQAIC